MKRFLVRWKNPYNAMEGWKDLPPKLKGLREGFDLLLPIGDNLTFWHKIGKRQ